MTKSFPTSRTCLTSLPGVMLAALAGFGLAGCLADSKVDDGTGGSGGSVDQASTGVGVPTSAASSNPSNTGGGTSTTEGAGGDGGAAGVGGTGGSGGEAPGDPCIGVDGAEVPFGESEACDELPDGTPVTYGETDGPEGICSRGARACEADGRFSACVGAVGAEARDCNSHDDNDCNGQADDSECTGCLDVEGLPAAIGAAESCFTFDAPAGPVGVCASGTKTCQVTENGLNSEWGPCEGEIGPTDTEDSCDPEDDGDENCDGTSRGDCACSDGDVASCGSCGGTQTCVDGSFDACTVPTPGDIGQACGSCGGTVQCDGSCSVGTPGNFGQACNGGCGTVQCDGTCSAGVGNAGQACGSCGGSVQCNGSCSVGTPGNLGQSCNAGCGTIQCNSTCSGGVGNAGQACGSCGGSVQCSGACSVGTPGNLGQACNACNTGRIQCSGACDTTCDFDQSGPNVAVGYGFCAPQKTGTSETVYCPGGTTPVYCSVGFASGFNGPCVDQGDGTCQYYTGQGHADANWSNGGCRVDVRAFNCDATTLHAVITCRG